MQEEYDPSQNMPQFVVTLTGLDPKLFPQEDMEIEQLDSSKYSLRIEVFIILNFHYLLQIIIFYVRF